MRRDDQKSDKRDDLSYENPLKGIGNQEYFARSPLE
jgi:hypothetical protein